MSVIKNYDRIFVCVCVCDRIKLRTVFIHGDMSESTQEIIHSYMLI